MEPEDALSRPAVAETARSAEDTGSAPDGAKSACCTARAWCRVTGTAADEVDLLLVREPP